MRIEVSLNHIPLDTYDCEDKEEAKARFLEYILSNIDESWIQAETQDELQQQWEKSHE